MRISKVREWGKSKKREKDDVTLSVLAARNYSAREPEALTASSILRFIRIGVFMHGIHFGCHAGTALFALGL